VGIIDNRREMVDTFFHFLLPFTSDGGFSSSTFTLLYSFRTDSSTLAMLVLYAGLYPIMRTLLKSTVLQFLLVFSLVVNRRHGKVLHEPFLTPVFVRDKANLYIFMKLSTPSVARERHPHRQSSGTRSASPIYPFIQPERKDDRKGKKERQWHIIPSPGSPRQSFQ
jgi:hypothetical protein